MVIKKYFGKHNNIDVHIFEISNEYMNFSVMEYGATIMSINVPDRYGNMIDTIVGFDNLSDFIKFSDYEGVTVGPYANRIAKGEFYLDGTKFNLVKNEKGIQSLHSNNEFSSAIWESEIVDDYSIKLKYFHEHLKNGYPGNIEAEVTYSLLEKTIRIEYVAKSDREVPINITNHAYFNLGEDSILNHELWINSQEVTEIDSNLIPTGKYISTRDRIFDFFEFKSVGKDIESNILKETKGYDHNYVIKNYDGKIREVAKLRSLNSGIELTVRSDYPGLQFYSGNYLNGVIGKGKSLKEKYGLCLEPQFFPNSPNMVEFPNTLAKKFRRTIEFQY